MRDSSIDGPPGLREPADLEVGQTEPCQTEQDHVSLTDLPGDGQALLRDSDDVVPRALIVIRLGLHRPPSQKRSMPYLGGDLAKLPRVPQRIGEPPAPRGVAPASPVDVHGVLNTSALVRVDGDGVAIVRKSLVPAPARPQIGSVAIPDVGMGERSTAALGSSQCLLQKRLVPDDVALQCLNPRQARNVSPIGRASESAVKVLDRELHHRLVAREAGEPH